MNPAFGFTSVFRRYRVGAWRGAVLSAILGLSACSVPAGLRDPGTPISATTRFDLARMEGRWQVRERAAMPDDAAGGAPESFVFGAGDSAAAPVSRAYVTCGSGECAGQRMDATARMTGPGRFVMPRDGAASVAHWVLWSDADYRVAAIGTPTGEFGWIMTRGQPRDDLMTAAREIMDWNGYDLSRLVAVSP